MTTGNKAKDSKAAAQAVKANNAEAAEAAKNDPTIAAAQSDSGSTGLYGAEGLDKKESKDKGTYIVKDGDSLQSVADEVGMEPVEIVALNPELAANGSNSNLLYTGQEIRLK